MPQGAVCIADSHPATIRHELAAGELVGVALQHVKDALGVQVPDVSLRRGGGVHGPGWRVVGSTGSGFGSVGLGRRVTVARGVGECSDAGKHCSYVALGVERVGAGAVRREVAGHDRRRVGLQLEQGVAGVHIPHNHDAIGVAADGVVAVATGPAVQHVGEVACQLAHKLQGAAVVHVDHVVAAGHHELGAIRGELDVQGRPVADADDLARPILHIVNGNVVPPGLLLDVSDDLRVDVW